MNHPDGYHISECKNRGGRMWFPKESTSSPIPHLKLLKGICNKHLWIGRDPNVHERLLCSTHSRNHSLTVIRCANNPDLSMNQLQQMTHPIIPATIIIG